MILVNAISMSQLIKIINYLLLVLISVYVGFLSYAFFLGYKEQHDNLVAQLPWSFFGRIAPFLLLGLILLAVIALIDWILNITLLRSNPVNLKRIIIAGLILITISCVTGSLFFFYY